MNRKTYLTRADAAVDRAAALARAAETAAQGDARHKAEPLAAVGELWASIARTHLLFADALAADDTTPEA